MAWGQYGNRVGVPRILRLLKKYDVPATFYVPAVAALLHPDEQRQVIAEGHEIGIHSWIHELNSVLSYEAESDIMNRAADTLEKITGVRPVGVAHRLVGLLAAHAAHHQGDGAALRLLADGGRGLLRADPRRRADRRGRAAGRMGARRRGLFHHAPPPVAAPADADRGGARHLQREFDAAYEEGGICQITCHPHIIGYRSRIWIIEELIRHAKSRPGVWFATHADVAAYAKEHAA